MWKTLCFLVVAACPASPLSAACLNPPLAINAINDFKSNPGAIVTPNSDARTTEAMARDLAGSDASLAIDLVKVAQGTIPRFQTAIAAGLAQAAVACESVDQKAALLIQEAVASFADGPFQASFAAVAGDLSTAATNAAVSYATSGFGSVAVINPNTAAGANITPGGGSGGVVPTFFFTTITTDVGSTNLATTAADAVSQTH